ncbi:MAG: hypothetical protein ACXW2E_09625 [Nitrososphaeraceae archaeon]
MIKLYDVLYTNKCPQCRERFYNTYTVQLDSAYNNMSVQVTCEDREQPVSEQYIQTMDEGLLADGIQIIQDRQSTILIDTNLNLSPHVSRSARQANRDEVKEREYRHQQQQPAADPNGTHASSNNSNINPNSNRIEAKEQDQKQQQAPSPQVPHNNRSLHVHATNPNDPPSPIPISSIINVDEITPTIIANHDKLIRKIPYECINLWIENCRRIFLNYLQNRANNNQLGKLNAIIALHMLPQTVLRTNSMRLGGTKQQKVKSRRLLNNRLQSNLQLLQLDANGSIIKDNIEPFNSDSDSESVCSDDSTRSQTSKSSADKNNNDGMNVNNSVNINCTINILTPLTQQQQLQQSNNISRSKSLIAEGYTGRATRALIQQSKPVDMDDEMRFQQLVEAHPIPSNDSNDHYTNLPKCPNDIPSQIILGDASFIKCVKELCNITILKYCY